MKKFTLILLCAISTQLFSQKKILFDCRKAETAGNADWVVDADIDNLFYNTSGGITTSGNKSNAQQVPTPAQSAINASTPETYWTGGLSAWGVDMAKQGFSIESMPYNASITYGDLSNPLDLSNYKVYIVDEPNIKYNDTEKAAIINFVKNGGGLFMISDHNLSDRNNDGWDSPHIWNDLMQTNTVQINPFGITFDYVNISPVSNNVVTTPSDSLTHGPGGTVAQVKWSNGTTMTLNNANNSTVAGDVYVNAPASGSLNALVAHAYYFNGRVAAMGDSSPSDDGTGNPSCTLYNGYFTDAAGNHQKFFINTTIWLAGGNALVTSIEEKNPFNLPQLNAYPNPTKDMLIIGSQNNNQVYSIELIDITGKQLNIQPEKGLNNEYKINLSNFNSGIYYCKVKSEFQTQTVKVIKQ
ncbi:MAG: T9SS type A sorting domain-containing protein [Bacteroidetes bacterium]|nr:T9SS type A sorting domain-containing protein [Bacteroidota bacterium]